MKTFWVVIVVVVGLAAGALVLRGGRAPKAIPVGEPTRIVMEDPKPAPPAPKQGEPAAANPEASKPEPIKPEPTKSEATKPEPTKPEPAPPAPVVAPPAPIESKPPAPTATPPEAGPAEAKPAKPSPAPPEPVPAPQPKASEQPKPVEEAKPVETPKPVDEAKPVVPPVAEPARAAAPGQIAPAPQTSAPLIPPAPAEVKSEPPPAPASVPPPVAKPSDAAPLSDGPPVIEKREDGSMLVDGKYEVKGDGSAEKPYEVTWEMLISAQETYQPKEGKKLIPGRLAMLDNKHVRVTGYIAFPLYVQEAREMLSMLNQWDGCCIGVPPTPYDAIEVRLKDAVTGPERFATFGSVEGRFGVKPYVVGDWLVGLYTLDDAKFNAKVFTGS